MLRLPETENIHTKIRIYEHHEILKVINDFGNIKTDIPQNTLFIRDSKLGMLKIDNFCNRL